jgi:hypothetical protein
MQELKHNELIKQYPDELLDAMRQIDSGITPVKVNVAEDLIHQTVKLTIGKATLTLARAQALDLAAELRKAANRIGVMAYEHNKRRKKRR